jgi:hypothetical protein
MSTELKVVPTTPTDAMCRAADGIGGLYAVDAPEVWSAMLDAAPAAWQPISSAPRDGSTIMLRFGEDGVSQGRYDHVPKNPGHPWQFIDAQGDADYWIVNRAVDGPGGPSHWMPMPGVSK